MIAWSTSEHGQPQYATPTNIACLVEQSLFRMPLDGTLHPNFDANIRTAIADKGYSGPVVLDIERTPRGKVWLEVLSRAQAIRPHARFGFYAVPRNQYWPIVAPWAHGLKWSGDVYGLRWLMDRVDVVFGNCYASYSIGLTSDHTIERWRMVVELSAIATLAEARARPAYLMFMPWFSNSREPWPTPLGDEQLKAAVTGTLACGVTPLFWAVTSPLGDKPDTVTPAALDTARARITAISETD